MSLTIPCRVTVKETLSTRYPDIGDNFYNNLKRPLSWDGRKEGKEDILDTEDQKITLNSNGQQPTPEPGWVLLLNGGSQEAGYTWTLYGMQN